MTMMNDFVVAILAVLVLLSVCITKVASQVVSDSGGFFELDEAGCVIDTRTSDDEVLCDFFVQKVPESASETIAAAGFSITYHNTFKVITNNVASDKEVYVAYLCGTDKPGQSEFQENNLDIDEVNDIVKYVQIPVREYGINAQNILPFLQSAGAGDQWSLFPSRALIPTCANEGRAEGDEVSQILCGFDANCVGDAWEDSGIEVMFTDNFGLSDTPSGTGNEGVEYVSIKLSADDSAVSVSNFDKLGWLYFAAAFFNKELEVESEVHSLSQQFGCVNTFLENTASFNAEVVEDEDRLHVLVLSGYISSFGGFFIGSCPSYYCEFALNADPTVRSILLSDLPSLVGFGFTADQLINALTEANIRVDRVILNSYVERLAIHEDNGNEPGPEDDINNFEFTTLTDFLRDFRRGIETNPREIEFEAFFVPDTDAWFQVRPGVDRKSVV